jgi:hypothetical protein
MQRRTLAPSLRRWSCQDNTAQTKEARIVWISILLLFLCQTVSSHFHLLRLGVRMLYPYFPENYLSCFKFAIF